MQKEVGTYLRSLRRNNNWNQTQVSERLGISVAAYSKLEAGVTDINLTRLVQLAEVFNITVQDIVCFGNSGTTVDAEELANCTQQLTASHKQISYMQVKLISLYEELRNRNFEYAVQFTEEP